MAQPANRKARNMRERRGGGASRRSGRQRACDGAAYSAPGARQRSARRGAVRRCVPGVRRKERKREGICVEGTAALAYGAAAPCALRDGARERSSKMARRGISRSCPAHAGRQFVLSRRRSCPVWEKEERGMRQSVQVPCPGREVVGALLRCVGWGAVACKGCGGPENGRGVAWCRCVAV